eukprot:Polyplicarium_translucidae@DN3304_c1_g1_i5.p1
MVSLSPLLAFNEAPFLTLPSVVYDSAGDRWVMTLSGASDSNGNQPTFYHSADGTDDWTAGGLFVPPAVEAEDGGPPHFRPFTNNFLVPMDGKWVMMGTRDTTTAMGDMDESRYETVFFIGELDDTTAVFESDYTNRGRPLFWDFGTRPFPVWNHEVHRHVMMNVMDPLVDDSPYKPLSLPVWFEPAVGTSEGIDYGEYLRSDWIDAVKSRIENGPPGDGSASGVVFWVPQEMVEGILAVNMTVTSARQAIVQARGGNLLVVDFVAPDEVDVRPSGGATTRHVLPLLEDGATEMAVSILVDRNLLELNLNGWTLRCAALLEIAESGLAYVQVSGDVRDGWTAGSVTPTQIPPTTTTTTTTTTTAKTTKTTTTTTTRTTTPSGSGGTRAKAGVALALLVVCFFR